MSQANNAGGLGAKWNLRSPWVSVAAVAVLAGLMLPLLAPGPSSPNPSLPPIVKAETKDKSKLEYSAPPMPDAPNLREMVTRLVFGTFLVLGLCVAAMWGMRRWLQPNLPTGDGQRKMQLAETLHLGNRCFLHLVQMGDQQILVSVDPAGIKSVSAVAKPFDEMLAEPLPAELPIAPLTPPSLPRLAA